MKRVHDLAVKHGISLKKISLDGMPADIELAKQLQPIEDEVRTALTLAEDTGTQTGSEAWEAFFAYDGVLSSMADRDPEIAAEIGSVIELMATGPRQKSAAAEK